MRAVNTGFMHDWISELGHGRSRLDTENIETRANTLRVNRLEERSLIHSLTTRSVDEISAVAHRFEKVPANQPPRIGLKGHVERRLHSFDAQLVCFFNSQAATPGDDRHAESAGAGNHFLANLPQTHQPKSTSEQS